MPREIVIIECTEARKEGKRPSRYMTTRNKKLSQEKVELKKYNSPCAATRCTRRSRAKLPVPLSQQGRPQRCEPALLFGGEEGRPQAGLPPRRS